MHESDYLRLLQAFNISHRMDEFGSGQEPPDVQFREANFEVFFVLDEGRRLNEEWRDEVERRRSAFSLSQLVRRHRRPRWLSAGDLQARLGPTLRKKAHNYQERGLPLGELDLLAFCNLKQAALDFNSPFPPPSEYQRQGWRSLSLVGPNFVRVLFTHENAPDFLRHNRGRTVLFDLGIGL